MCKARTSWIIDCHFYLFLKSFCCMTALWCGATITRSCVGLVTVFECSRKTRQTRSCLLTDPRSQTRRPRSPCEPLVRTPPLLHTHIRTPFNNAGIKNSRAVLTRGMILNGSRGGSLQTIFFLFESCLRCNGHFEVSEVTDEGSFSSW